MKIYTTALDELSAFRRFFEGHTVELLPKDYSFLPIDLLLFPGGSDVHPKNYGGKIPAKSQYAGWIDEPRDEWELGVFKNFLRGRTKVRKVLGVCRGMQLLNVGLGGTLVYDIASRYGKPHPNVHSITWNMENSFSPIQEVNSIHHQGIYTYGDMLNPRILGNEPNTGVIEAILWGDTILGTQFHPELWGNRDEMRVFSQGILDWVEGKSLVATSNASRERASRERVYGDKKLKVSYEYEAVPAAYVVPDEIQNLMNSWAEQEHDPDGEEEDDE